MKKLLIAAFTKKRAMLSIWVAVVVVGTQLATPVLAAPTNITVDFATSVRPLAAQPFSGTISTYGDQYNIINSPAQRAVLADLDLGMYRVPIRYNNGSPVSAAGGFPSGSGSDWITNIKAIGAESMIVVGGETGDNTFTAQDAANLVTYFNQTTDNPVKYWILGNEPDNGGAPLTVAEYCTLFNAAATAMKAVDPTIKVGGPAWSHFSSGNVRDFITCAKNTVDIVDYHEYPNSNPAITDAQVMAATGDQRVRIAETRAMINEIVPARSGQIEIQVGEFNWAWHQNDSRVYQGIATAWGAADIGGTITAGGRVHHYADLNGQLGLTFDRVAEGQQPHTPMPLYRSLQMFTGGTLFRGYGTTAVQASTSLPDVEVFASTNQKNVVVVNKSSTASQFGSIQMNGVTAGTAQVWQTDKDAPFAAPVQKAVINFTGGKVEYNLPPYSVTTFVVSEDTTNPIVEIIAPTSGQQVTGSVPFTATASDNIAVASVEFYVNGVRIATDTAAPYSTTWNTASVANGTHQLQAKAIDAASHSTMSPPQPVVVANAGPATTSLVANIGVNKCLDNAANARSNGNKVQIYTCNSSAAQKWTMRADGSVAVDNSNYCLDVKSAGTTPGTVVQLYTCNGTVAQAWQYNATTKTLVNPNSGLCLDIPTSNSANGTPVQLYTCNGTNAQKWTRL